VNSKSVTELGDFSKLLPIGAVSSNGLESIPLLYRFPDFGSITFVTGEESAQIVSSIIENITINLCAKFVENIYIHVFDPLDFGYSFQNLASIPKQLKSPRVATSSSELTKQLEELRSRITAVNQDILSGQERFTDFERYLDNNLASNEKIHLFLCNGFPYRWSKDQLEQLQDIFRLGSRAGVYCLLSVRVDQKSDDNLDKKIVELFKLGTNFCIDGSNVRGAVHAQHPLKSALSSYISLYSPHKNDFEKEVGKVASNLESAQKRVVDIQDVVRKIGIHSQNSIKEVRIPIGVHGNENLQEFLISDSVSAYHAIVGGATGSGKTVLLHNIILFGSYLYPPEELQFCLLDYKEGTEFSIYKTVANVRVLSIESQNEFGLSFLSYIQEFIKERGNLFKKMGVSNIKDARQASSQSLPRIVVVIDEFQVFLSDSFRGSARVAELLDDLTKRGRSFGIHLILSSQSLSGIQMQLSTLAQMPIRIVLKVTSMDSEKFLQEGNLEPSYFRRQGQAVYNTHSGAKDDNSYFNVSYIDEKGFDRISKEIENETVATDFSNGLPRKVFDPNEENLIDFSKINYPEKATTLTLGKAFFMSAQDNHTVHLNPEFPSNIVYSAGASRILYAFSWMMMMQLLEQKVRVFCIGAGRSIRYLQNFTEESDSVKYIDSANELDNLICGLLLETSDLNDQTKIKTVIIIPDINELEFLVDAHGDLSEEGRQFGKLLKKSSDLTVRIIMGGRNKRQLDGAISFYDFSSYFSERIILSHGTDCESMFGFENLHLKSGMCAHLSTENERQLNLFQLYSTEPGVES
jgi:hypothetical protein